MLELLSNSLPDTPALLGTAEEIPLPDNSVDAVLVAQAWHWFDPERAVKEVARVLRPGGRLGLVWNTRDERLGWVKDLGRIIGHEHDPFSHKVTLPEPFTDVERHQVEWTSYLTPQALIDLVASRSYCITSPERCAPARWTRSATCWPPIPRWPTPPAWRCRTSRWVSGRRWPDTPHV